MVLNSRQRQVGKDNFDGAVRVTRRQMLTGALTVPTAAGLYFGYDRIDTDPVRVGVIGTGDQGNALIAASNPDYNRVVAFSDIRPSNQKRTWRNLHDKYGDAAKNIKLYVDYREMLDDADVEMVVVALPLHLHAEASIKAMEAGKHVLCEKLMAKTVMESKEMVRAADKEKKLLAIGHQRHYSYLYHNCLALIEREDKAVLGDIRYIRAFWHRNQTAGGADHAKDGRYDGWFRQIPIEDLQVNAQQFDYQDLEQLVRWRLDNRTGGGLMVELGSHQLDACSIFLGKQRPRAVHGTGVVSFFEDGRDVDDHIFLTYEFPGDVVVTYSSICTNAFDEYGEQVMGTRGTMIVLAERDAYVYREGAGKDARITWAEARLSRPAIESGATDEWVTSVETANTLTSRGYREQQEHMAWLIRNPDKIDWPGPDNEKPDLRYAPRCHGRVGLDDGVIALVSNLAMASKQRIELKDAWFDPYSDEVPETEYGA